MPKHSPSIKGPPQSRLPNLSHPLMRELVGWWPMLGPVPTTAATNKILDISEYQNHVTTFVGTPTWEGISLHGARCIDLDAAVSGGDCVRVADNDLFDGMDQLTVSLWVKLETAWSSLTNSFAHIIGKNLWSSQRSWRIRHEHNATANTRIRWHVSNDGNDPGSAECVIDEDLITLNNWHHIVVTFDDYDSNLLEFWRDGVRHATGTGENGAIHSGSAPLTIGGVGDSPVATYTTTFPGKISDVRIWRRRLRGAEIQELYLDPWSPLKRRRLLFVGAGTDYTITAAGGVIAVSGTAASLEYGRAIDAETTSYTVSGTDAALERGYVVSAEAGSVSVAGTSAGLVHDGVLAAEAGSVAVSGTDATLNKGRMLSAEAGSVSVSGTDAGLVHASSISAESGSISVSGTDAGLIHGRYLSALSAAINVTGTDANLERGSVIAAEAGSATLSGSDATLIYSEISGVSSGARMMLGCTI